MPSISPHRRKLECIIYPPEEDQEYSFGLGVTADYLPEEPISPNKPDRLDRIAYNIGLRVYHIDNKITDTLSHIRMITTMLVVYSEEETGKSLKAVSKSIRELKQIKSRHPVSKYYLEKRIPRLEAQHKKISECHKNKPKQKV